MRGLRLVLLLAVALTACAGIVIVLSAALSASQPDVAALASRVPRRTALMRQRIAEARLADRPWSLDQRWVSYERISPLLRRAVLIAEDAGFYSHGGLDWHEIRAAVRRNVEARQVVRGASTITQQLARNLYLGNERTMARKVREIVLAWRLERTLTKRRIFELYLNLIEWGEGIYGIEAAARRHFGVPAAALDARQSALLAAVIINPRRYDPVHPTRRIERRARMILSRMRHRGWIDEAEYLAAVGATRGPPARREWQPDAPDSTPPVPGTPDRGAPAVLVGRAPPPAAGPLPMPAPGVGDSGTAAADTLPG